MKQRTIVGSLDKFDCMSKGCMVLVNAKSVAAHADFGTVVDARKDFILPLVVFVIFLTNIYMLRRRLGSLWQEQALAEEAKGKGE